MLFISAGAKNTENFLVIVGGGFICLDKTNLFRSEEYPTTILGNLEPQVHGTGKKIPAYVTRNSFSGHSTVLDSELLKKTVCEASAAIHLGALVTDYSRKGF